MTRTARAAVLVTVLFVTMLPGTARAGRKDPTCQPGEWAYEVRLATFKPGEAKKDDGAAPVVFELPDPWLDAEELAELARPGGLGPGRTAPWGFVAYGAPGAAVKLFGRMFDADKDPDHVPEKPKSTFVNAPPPPSFNGGYLDLKTQVPADPAAPHHVRLEISTKGKREVEFDVPAKGTRAAFFPLKSGKVLVLVSVVPCGATGDGSVYQMQTMTPAQPVRLWDVSTEYASGGEAYVQTLVTETGHATDFLLIKGDEGMIHPAVYAMRGWEFAPALVDGQPVRSLYIHHHKLSGKNFGARTN